MTVFFLGFVLSLTAEKICLQSKRVLDAPFLIKRYELFFCRPTIFQTDNAIEHQRTGLAVFAVGDEVAMTLELEMCFGRGVGQAAFHEALANVF